MDVWKGNREELWLYGMGRYLVDIWKVEDGEELELYRV